MIAIYTHKIKTFYLMAQLYVLNKTHILISQVDAYIMFSLSKTTYIISHGYVNA